MNQRYLSLDVFRGLTVAFMILVNNPGTWSHVYAPLRHAKWHGLTPTDLVFPFFLFAVGNALAFVIPRLKSQGDRTFWRKVITRSLFIFAIGLFLNWFPFSEWEDNKLVYRGWEWTTSDGELAGLRIMGVLQRIAICYFAASVIVYYTNAKVAGIIGCLILAAYWLICIAMNPADPFSMNGWFGTAIDTKMFGVAHIYQGNGVPFENEGFVSTIPAIAQVIFGYVVGDYIRTRGQATSSTDTTGNVPTDPDALPIYKTISVLFTGAVLMLIVGYLWHLTFPVNKLIQSSSFIVVTSGLAIALLSTLVYFIDARKYNGLFVKFFSVFGKNALFIYVLSSMIGGVLGFIRFRASADQDYTSPLEWFYEHVCKLMPGPEENASLFYAVSLVLLFFVIGYIMDRKKIYVKV